ncbi:undecaprenyldiphospho-muramoylpentapeptide beta-N-acetylglucosaminyltransferase [Aliiglaciecola sp. 3_MG-2023]|uniref:undecaprenyldiphospho-muramoylpentapeptide beta-N-acetylglucosaminyltransferase n=1 Tax=Aliiglaciecola sp. 3_MG-2023 TaxID=3062644 RepID=UPI0026E18806|nr:undecaprenyldiphospho-muramoylpentapeptide beta-N-acetylglucosaminyltransferase [Aliiglaciecola sp. 3_MG-2023]MDO6692858.1 undecaprenyldiphospho-muramoylpentapeptide beta-N-acetylglucosaminyltransferase [Aliiglaciecola sp. 3_MG-2023]
MNKTILIMAGGTGGHVFPGIAVAKELQQRNWHIHWLGTAARMEADIVPKEGFDISFIDVAGVRGNGILRLLKAPFQVIHSVYQALKVIKQINPDVVLGMGGFASGPGGIAAWIRGIPLVVHEQNALPGLTNKVLAKFAKRVLTGFNQAFGKQSANKYNWVGNPVRSDFANLPAKQANQGKCHILIVGGSLGASALNTHVPPALAEITNAQVRHQTGKGHQQSVTDTYQQVWPNSDNWQVTEFIDDMAEAYAWADVVICRAGALTVAEVAMVGVAAIFVPLPHAVDDHQTMNARALVDHHAAVLLPQPQLEEGGLKVIIQQLVNDGESRVTMGQKARSLAKPQATKTVSDICATLGGEAS